MRQIHGLIAEELIAQSSFFYYDVARPAGAVFDFPSFMDRRFGYPTQVKMCKGNTVALSSALRFWAIEEAFRLLVLRYRERPHAKEIYEVREYLLMPDYLEFLRAGVSMSDLFSLHEMIIAIKPRDEIGMVKHRSSRRAVRQRIMQLFEGRSLDRLRLNPKIDRAHQRRLQCSIPLNVLDRTVGQEYRMIHRERYANYVLPLAFSV